MESAKRLYLKVLKDSNYRETYDYFFTTPIIQQMSWKNKQLSEDARKKGNVLFLNKPHSAEQHKAILELYNESIAHALPESEELAFAYGNRSALFIHLNKYKECIEDTERALRITQSSNFKVKLFCRKAQALKELGSNEGQHALLKAKDFLQKVSKNDASKKTLTDIIDKTETMLKTKANNIVSDSSEESLIESIRRLQIDDKKTIFQSVTVDYNDKYGRFLIANRDYLPGEIIFSEEFYAATLNLIKKYSYCDNCVKPCWVLIPCNYCTWAMYCSEQCKSEAFENHHYVECTLISIIKENESLIVEGRMSIRLLLMAIKEAGSIESLMAELKKVDNESDASSKEFFTEKNFERKFTAAYRLQCFMMPSELDDHSLVAVNIILTKLLYRNKMKITSVEDMLKNEDLIFIGSLLLKFFKMRLINSYSIETAVDINCDHPKQHLYNYCKKIGTGLGLISSLINHSCLPNVSRAINENKFLVFFAIGPIKAGSPLFDSYQASFYELSKFQRLQNLEKYQFICNCEACKNNLPTYSMEEMHNVLHVYLWKLDSNGKISNRMLEIERLISKFLIKDNTDNGIQEYPQIIKEISSCMKKVFKRCPLSSKAACQLYLILNVAYRNFFDVNKFNYRKCS